MLTNNESIILYFLSFILSLCFAYAYDKSSIKFLDNPSRKAQSFRFVLLALAALPLILLGSFRVNTGIDQKPYSDEFYSISMGGYAHTDKGFQILNLILYKMGFNDSALFIFCSALLIISFFCLIKSLNISFSFSLFLFIFSFQYLNSFSLIAQYTAIAFLCLAMRSLVLNHKLSGLVFILLAVSMHSSAVIIVPMVILYLLFKYARNKRFVLILFAIIGISVGFSIKVLTRQLLSRTRFVYYLNNTTFSDLHSGSMILVSVLTIVFMTILLPEVFKERHNSLLLTLYVIQFMFAVLSVVQSQVTLLFRLLYYLWFGSIISIPMYVRLIRNDKLRNFTVLAICIFYICWMIYFPLRGNYYNILPYQYK